MIGIPRSFVLVVGWSLVLAGCEEPAHVDEPLQPPETEEIDLGVDVRLDDVEGKFLWAGDYFLAVGEGGLIVDQNGQSWDLGDAHLRAVEFDKEAQRWWVAGDGGFVAYANDDGVLDWVVPDIPTDANLEAIGFWGEGDVWEVVLVGDEILLVGAESGTEEFEWMQPTPPPGGWGHLRDVWADDADWSVMWIFIEDSLWAAGDGGRMLISTGSPYDWTVVDTDTAADLNCAFWGLVHGDGVLLQRGDFGDEIHTEEDHFSWLEHLTPGVDVIGCAFELVIADDRRVHGFRRSDAEPRYEELLEFDWQPRALDDMGTLLVGDDGHVVRLTGPFD